MSRWDVPDLVARARCGEPRAVSRLISLVETDTAAGRALLRDVAARLAPYTGRAHVVGLTGPPGVGKSTSTSALVTALRRRGRKVGVLAVDPSSPFSGGALLGDRVRMGEHATDEGVFIRSMASRGHLGGLAWSTPQALRVLDAAGCDVVLIETVGVGQSEVEVVGAGRHHRGAARTGDGRRRAGREGRDPRGRRRLAVNKADRDGARRTVRDLEYAIAMSEAGRHGGLDAPRRLDSGGARRGDRRPRGGAGRAPGVARRIGCRGRSGAGRGPLPRSRRSRWIRCGRGSVTCGAPGRCPGWPIGWWPGTGSLPGRRRAAGHGAADRGALTVETAQNAA